jgi:hypothetical protein
MCVNILDGIKSFWFNYIIFILLGVMPVFNFIGYWDDTLSGSMYSGTHSNVVFYFDPYNEPELPKFRQYATVVKEKSDSESLFYKTWFYTWSIYDIKVPVYQADRYYKRYGKVLCENVKEPLASGIEITTRSKFSGHQIITKCSCLELLSAND